MGVSQEKIDAAVAAGVTVDDDWMMAHGDAPKPAPKKAPKKKTKK